MTTTTDHGPDVQVSNANTGEVYPSQVRAEIDRLDGAATEAPVRVGGWTPNPDYYIPAHVATLLKPLTREQLDAEDTAAAGDPIPGCDDLREQIRLTHASGRLVSLLEAKAQLWHEIASQAWASQGERSRISEHYTGQRGALLSAYEAECERIKDGLIRTPGVEYGGHVYDQDRGYVPVESAKDDAVTTPQPERPEVEAMTARVRARAAREQREAEVEPPTQTPETLEVPAEPPTSVGGRWRWEWRQLVADGRRIRAAVRRGWRKIRDWDGSGA